MSATAYVRHTVADYDAWRRVYDSDAVVQLQNSGGVTAKSVHRLVGDGNDLMVVHSFDSVSAAEAFLHSDGLRGAMQEAGVTAPPRVEIFEDA